MSENVYEKRELVSQYLLFHYGRDDEVLPWPEGPSGALGFPRRCVEEMFLLDEVSGEGRALDVGCAVGRSSFELARTCGDVVGIDFSHAFVMTAMVLCREQSLSYEIVETGTRVRVAEARRPDGVDCSRVHFEQGDAQDLREGLGQFDLVLAANLLCRLGDPRRFLTRLRSLVKPGGQLVITTPNTWLEEFTASEFWLGATPETGEPLEALKDFLLADFELEKVADMPFLIREHLRKYQWSVAQATRWRRKR